MKLRSSLAQQGVFILVLPLIVQLILTISLVGLLKEAEREAARAVHARELSDAVSRFTGSLMEMPRITSPERGPLEPEYELAKQGCIRSFEKVVAMVADDPERTAALMEAAKLARQSMAIIETAHSKEKQPGEDPELKILKGRNREVKIALGDLLSEKLLPMALAEKEVAERAPEAQARLRERSATILFFATCLSFIFTISFILIFMKWLVARLDVMSDNCVRFASRQSLRPAVGGADEIARLDRVFHQMTDEIAVMRRKERALIENARDLICSMDGRGNFIEVGGAADRLTGYSPAELLGSKVFNLFGEEDSESVEQIRALLENGGEGSFECRLRRKDGRVIDVIWSLSWSEEEKSMFCVAHDVSEQRQAERLRQEITRMVTHDLKTPLGTISIFLEMLEDGIIGNLDDRGKQGLKAARISTATMIRLTRDLLDIDRLESGMLLLDKKPVDLSLVIEQCLEMNSAEAEDKQISLECKPTDLIVLADRDRLAQIFTNLLSNAIKFSPPRSKVSIAVEKCDGFARICITDRGRGIPSSMQEAVFDRYSQLHSSDATDKGGTGLGLSICKALVELHGGSIHVESREFRGSSFIFTIPIDTAEESLNPD